MRIKSLFKTLISRIKQLIFEFKEMHAILIGCLLSIQLMAIGDGTTPTSIFDVMNHKEVLQVTLETDIEKLKSDISNEEYQPAFLSFKDAAGVEQAWKLKVKLRGKFRRMNCSDVPPLKLNFSKSDLEMAGLAKFDDMKLVPQCVEDRVAAEDYVKREYLAYRLFNEISPYSFRVQLLRITYIDSGTGKRRKQWGILIEDTAQLRARIGGEKCKDCYNQPISEFHEQATRLVSLYQYMIGNPDWSMAKMKNVKLFKLKGKIVPVPYDFDFTGLVDASYVTLDPSIGITSKRDRVYLGFYEEQNSLDRGVTIFKAKRKKLTKLVQDSKYLSVDSRTDVVEYLNTFWENDSIKFPPEPEVAEHVEGVLEDR